MTGQAPCGLIVALLLVGGCAPGPFYDSAWPEQRPLGGRLDVVSPAVSQAEIGAPDLPTEPTGELSLRDALAAALLRSPNLAATAFAVRAREAEALQAGLAPNPEIGFEFENFGGTGESSGIDTLETTLALSQVVELGGKRVKRRRVAEHGARLAGWEYEIRRIDVLSKTAADFVGLLATERSLLMASESLELAQQVFDAVGDRVDAGKISPVERAKARIELAGADLGRQQALRAVVGARFRLASNWGSTSPQFESLAGDFDHIEPPPSLETLLDRIGQNPDLARWTAEAALRQAELELALAQRTGDLAFTVGVRHFNELDEAAFVAGLSMPLPIYDRNQGGTRAARLRALEGGRLGEAARVQVHTAVAQAFQVLDAAFVSARTIHDEIVPSAELAFEAAEEAFRQGKIGTLDLLDAQRTLFAVRGQLTDALTTYHLAVIASERLIGAELHDNDQPEGTDR